MSGTTRTVSEIPLISAPQSFSITLNAVIYNLTIAWNTVSQSWILNIADNVTNTPILQGIPLVTGADLLEQYAYAGIGGSLYVQSDGDITAVPDFNDLGSAGHLYFVTPQDPIPT